MWFLTLPPALYLAVAMSAHMNIGMRHVLPMYAFLTVLEAGAATTLARESRKWLYVLIVLVAMQVVTSVKAFPEYIPYANELWGGSSQTYKLLSDSNADWGQQLKATSRYLRERGVKDCWFSYFAEGVVPYQYYGIPCKALPTPDAQWIGEKFYDVPAEIDGPVLISGSNLSGYEYGPAELNPYAQFQQLRPTAVIQNGIYVFDGHFAIPMAAAIGHVQKSQEFLATKQFEDALQEAKQAVALAPTSVKANVVLGDVLAALGQKQEAQQVLRESLDAGADDCAGVPGGMGGGNSGKAGCQVGCVRARGNGRSLRTSRACQRMSAHVLHPAERRTRLRIRCGRAEVAVTAKAQRQVADRREDGEQKDAEDGALTEGLCDIDSHDDPDDEVDQGDQKQEEPPPRSARNL